jgi:hypothetical protein
VKFQSEADAYRISNAEAYGVQVANYIFEWSETDGGHETCKHILPKAASCRVTSVFINLFAPTLNTAD